MTTSHYTPQVLPDVSGDAVLRNIAKAYKRAGLPVPTRTVDGVAAFVAAEPTPADVVAAVAATANDATDPATWLADAVDRINRATAAERLREHLAATRTTTTGTTLDESTARAARDLTPCFSAAVAQLHKAATGLPEGDAALDVEANLHAHTSRALEDATAALATLSVLAGIYPASTGPGATVPRGAVTTLRVLDLPDTAVERIDQLSGEPLDASNPTRETIRAFGAYVRDHGADLALVQAARGTWGDVITFSLPHDRRALAARTRRLGHAFARETVKNGIVEAVSRRAREQAAR